LQLNSCVNNIGGGTWDMKVKDLMSTNVLTISKDTSVEEIAGILAENNISGVPVVDEENRVIGIVTQKDLLYKDIKPRFPAVVEILGGMIFLSGVKEYNTELKKLVATKAEELMTKKVITISPDSSVEKAAAIMVDKNINRIPVVDEGNHLLGIISRADIIRSMAK